jgi:predicted transcriptional regulator
MAYLKLSEGAQLSDALQQLGAKRVEAALVASLAEGQALGTRDIVEKTGLRQPEVSVGMQELRDRHWVAFDAVPRQGKGRPMHRYRLVANREDIRSYYESQARGVMAAFESALSVVRQRLS